MERLPRVLDDQGGWIHLALDGAFFAIDSTTRRVCWSDPMGPSLLHLPGIRHEVRGPATYNHLDLYYDGDWAPPAYTPRSVEDLQEGDLVTWEGCLRTVKNTAPGARGKIHVFVDHSTFAGPYPRDPRDLVPLHPRD
ncbi:hypothetical protein [Streptomyces noursei]|uniref:hypothetical protein n=1 Tax=Streptomyces noursei TaxID=1971 RepID=UPI00167429F2|nr:hypothetical protein [Streptomyces noursei]MCZ1021443.1 hypothetical protein [Streptomyces noursei]GGX46498.1 hypothetical protein GCM10010341_80310 [Streptomyces noursei]